MTDRISLTGRWIINAISSKKFDTAFSISISYRIIYCPLKPRKNKLGNKNIIGEQVTRIRVSKGISQKEFVAKLQSNDADTNPSSVSELEGQTRQVIDKEIMAIAKASEVSILDLFP